jgi:hypothetical protein
MPEADAITRYHLKGCKGCRPKLAARLKVHRAAAALGPKEVAAVSLMLEAMGYGLADEARGRLELAPGAVLTAAEGHVLIKLEPPPPDAAARAEAVRLLVLASERAMAGIPTGDAWASAPARHAETPKEADALLADIALILFWGEVRGAGAAERRGGRGAGSSPEPLAAASQGPHEHCCWRQGSCPSRHDPSILPPNLRAPIQHRRPPPGRPARPMRRSGSSW